MDINLLEIQPEELKFKYESKKQSSCSVRLINNSRTHVAFKVKTTVPKKYCVRPNVGIIMPKSTYDFTVIMQAQGPAPSDLVCKDKFLVQSTVVSGSTTNEDITRDMFVKGGDKYVEERKLRVSLITPTHSPINGEQQEPAFEASILKDEEMGRLETLSPQEKIAKDEVSFKMTNGAELRDVAKSAKLMPTMDANLLPASDDAGHVPIKNAKLSPASDAGYISVKSAELPPTKDAGSIPIKNEESSRTKDANFKQARDEGVALTKNSKSSPTKDGKSNPTNDEGFALAENAELTPGKDAQLRPVKAVELVLVNDAEKLVLVNKLENLKSKLIELELKLSEAEATISKLTEENRLSNRDSQILRKELERRGRTTKRGARKVKEGFPLLFVCMVALLCIMLGYRLRSGV